MLNVRLDTFFQVQTFHHSNVSNVMIHALLALISQPTVRLAPPGTSVTDGTASALTISS